MDFYEVFVRAPVNSSARNILSGKPCVEEDVSSEELVYLIQRLLRKRRLLNKTLGIDTKAKARNLRYKLNKNRKTIRQAINPRGTEEWARIGDAIRHLEIELKSRKSLNEQENQTIQA